MDADFRKKILLVDADNSQTAELKGFLEFSGYSAHATANYQEAMTSIQNWKPDLVILNILIQTFNPVDFIGEVKENPFTGNQKIIIFSQTPHIDIVTGPTPKVQGYLTKPLDFDALKSALLRAAGPTGDFGVAQ